MDWGSVELARRSTSLWAHDTTPGRATPPARANYTQEFALLHEHPLRHRVPRIGAR